MDVPLLANKELSHPQSLLRTRPLNPQSPEISHPPRARLMILRVTPHEPILPPQRVIHELTSEPRVWYLSSFLDDFLPLSFDTAGPDSRVDDSTVPFGIFHHPREDRPVSRPRVDRCALRKSSGRSRRRVIGGDEDGEEGDEGGGSAGSRREFDGPEV